MIWKAYLDIAKRLQVEQIVMLNRNMKAKGIKWNLSRQVRESRYPMRPNLGPDNKSEWTRTNAIHVTSFDASRSGDLFTLNLRKR